MVQAWFDATHEIEAQGMGAATCRLVRLPEAGAMGDQEAWLVDALGVMRAELNAILHEQAAGAARA